MNEAVSIGALASKICSVPTCRMPHYARGWCSAHYQRWRTHGDPEAGRSTMNGEPQRFFEEVVLGYDGDECLTWPFARDAYGYAHMALDGRVEYIARLVCERVIGEPPTVSHQAAHSCGKGRSGCCAKAHLSWKTPAENTADKFVHGTVLRGEQVGTSKLTAPHIMEIRSLRGLEPQRQTADRFGISQRHVSDIQRKLRWGWL